MSDAYQECLAYLFGRLNYERDGMPRSPSELRLGRMSRLLRGLGDPQKRLRIVHVAGTKGKGSTAVMVASALTASGVRTGLFCSPHLHRLEERFTIDGQPASAEELVALTAAVQPVIAHLDLQPRFGPATFFEATTAMGLLHFARREVGAVVLEVGLGGRLDSTNAVRPAVSVITTISFDHTKLLGNTLGRIAHEKAGILKRGRPAVSGVRGQEARAAIDRVARQRRVPLRAIDVDFDYQYAPPVSPISEPTGGRVTVRTWGRDWGTLNVPLLGPHQAHNVATALATLDALAEQGLDVGREAVVRGFQNLTWPARVEVLGRAPWLVIDGAHNVASAEALAETLPLCLPPGPRTLVFGTTRDKDLRGQLRALLPRFDRVIATRYVENPRAVPPEAVSAAVEALGGPEALLAANPAEALALARAITPTEGLICVTGSLFLAAEARAHLLGLESTPSRHPLTT
jgi:dihydrofolate synthase/folylpolyglutamate synthase